MPDQPIIAVTVSEVTTPCADAARTRLETAGYAVRVFPATGNGGREMEAAIRARGIAGVLDLTTSELADELVGGIYGAGPNRLTAAAIMRIPQVISVGGLDAVSFASPDSVPAKYAARRFHMARMRTTPEEMDRLGKEIAEKASASNAPTAVVLPLRGVSALDAEGEPFWWPEVDAALFQSVRNWIAPYVELIELDLHLNHPAFAAACTAKLLEMLTHGPR